MESPSFEPFIPSMSLTFLNSTFPLEIEKGKNHTRSAVRELFSLKCGKSSFMEFKNSIIVNRIFDMESSRMRDFEDVYKSSINSLDVDKSGRYLLSGCKDGSVFIHDLFNFTGQKVYRCKVVSKGVTPTDERVKSVETVQWYPFDSGMFLTSGLDHEVHTWDPNTMKVVQSFNIKSKVFQHHVSPVLSESSPLVAVASGLSNVMMADLRTGQYCQQLRGHTNTVFCCRWSPTDPHILATGSNDCTIRLWDARSSRACFAILDMDNRPQDENPPINIFRSHNGSVNGLEFTPNGNLLLSLGSDDEIRCWDVHSLKNLNIPYDRINNRKSRSIGFATYGFRNSHFFFVPDQFKIVIYEVETGCKVKTLTGHYSQVNTCYFHKDSMELYSGGQDRNIHLWTVERKDEVEENFQPFISISCGTNNWDNDGDRSGS